MIRSASDANGANRTAVEADDLVTVDRLIRELSGGDWRQRRAARQALVAIGSIAVAPLGIASRHPNRAVRWEAAKTLCEIGSPLSAPALVRAMEDSDRGVRWMAAGGVIGLGLVALPALLQALIHRRESAGLRECARYVLRNWRDRGLNHGTGQVLEALENGRPAQVRAAAQQAMDEFGAVSAGA